ncbi:unnamed protein product [Orchesella dallaii]|uniref:Integrase catalytic domain-containing protein n=1 Tax=Orchesella dallaii TaxID=48710 RepID=A0ABP1PKZ6_9HEXA
MLRAVANCLKTGALGLDVTNMAIGELKEAELHLVKILQENYFEGTNDTRFKQLDVFMDEKGHLRLRTRLLLGDFEDDFKTPLVLPAKGPIVEALIKSEHEKNSHAGVQTLTIILRERFWILHARRTIRGVITKCQECKRFDARKMNCNTPALPRERLHADIPFQVTGVDYFGPLFMKNGTKTWVALFTCAVYRAIHLELVSSMTTDAFISALRRFISRRGRPDIIFSDNGSNFVGCNNLFQEIDWKRVEKYGVCHRIAWRFNPPTAAWWGGWWERLVGVVKKCLRRVLGKSILTFEEMQTILCDVEAVVNQRPLTYVSENPTDLTPLSPYLFVVGHKTSHIPEADLVDGLSLNTRLKFLQRLRKDLRSRFRKEYLGQLRCWGQAKETRKLKVGDVVLVGQDNIKRIDWPLATIVQLFPGKDGKVRVVKVKTEKGDLLRPIQRIYPMEANNEQVAEEDCQTEEEQRGESKPDRRVEVITRYGRKVKIPQRFTMISVNSGKLLS